MLVQKYIEHNIMAVNGKDGFDIVANRIGNLTGRK